MSEKNLRAYFCLVGDDFVSIFILTWNFLQLLTAVNKMSTVVYGYSKAQEFIYHVLWDLRVIWLLYFLKKKQLWLCWHITGRFGGTSIIKGFLYSISVWGATKTLKCKRQPSREHSMHRIWHLSFFKMLLLHLFIRWGSTYDTVHLWESEGNLWELVLSFHPMVPGDLSKSDHQAWWPQPLPISISAAPKWCLLFWDIEVTPIYCCLRSKICPDPVGKACIRSY